jgi:hypothetical protein
MQAKDTKELSGDLGDRDNTSRVPSGRSPVREHPRSEARPIRVIRPVLPCSIVEANQRGRKRYPVWSYIYRLMKANSLLSIARIYTAEFSNVRPVKILSGRNHEFDFVFPRQG